MKMDDYSLEAIKIARELIKNPEYLKRLERERNRLNKIIEDRIELRLQKKPTIREVIKSILYWYKFSKKQTALMNGLTKSKPVKTNELEEKTRSKKIRSLIRDTNYRFKKYHLPLKIKSRKNEGLSGFYSFTYFSHSKNLKNNK